MRIVGIDAGATSTRCLVVDENGCVLGYGLGGPSNHTAARLQKALDTVFSQAFPKEKRPFVESLCLGRAGSLPKELVENIVRHYVQTKFMHICGDMKIAFWGATLGYPGILIYAGTGSNTYGIDEKGNEVQVGGWGYIIDDEGSGYDIGRQALKQVFRAEDGRSPPTVLREKILAYFNCATLAELLKKVYQNNGLPRSEIAALSKIVAEAAEEGDQIAQEILAKAGRALAYMVIVALRRLHKDDQSFPVYPAGGVFRAGSYILAPFKEELLRSCPRVEIKFPQFPPVAGAIFLALQGIDLQLTKEFLFNLTKGLEEIGWLTNY